MRLKKTLFTLAVNNYTEEITNLTFPLMKHWAKKIDADFYVIEDRKFPNFPPVYEKLQIYELGKILKNDWNIFLDADALVHPDTPDWTVFMNKDTVAHNGIDVASTRWRYDEYFHRDGRHISSCNWNAIASDWCIDLWKPLDDLTLEQALENIYPTHNELSTVVTKDHLIDDYTLSRNIAKYGLKLRTLMQIANHYGIQKDEYYYHLYTYTNEEKIKRIKETLVRWGI